VVVVVVAPLWVDMVVAVLVLVVSFTRH